MISWALVYVGLALCAPLCVLAQRLAPADDPLPPVLDRTRAIDWAYWLVTPLFTGLLTRVTTLGIAAMVAFAAGLPFHDANDLMDVFHARSPIAAWPLVVQALVALVGVDFLSYWSHRIRHQRWFWPLHAVHHSAEKLDWLAAARMHPLDDLADNVVVFLPVLLLGFDPRIFVSLGPVLILHTLYLHASVRLSLGPLRFVIATPDFHRWHHAVEVEARDANYLGSSAPAPPVRALGALPSGSSGTSTPAANYGGVLAIWDVLFGTFRMPAERATRFGVDEASKMPERLGAQMIEPIRRLAERRG